MPKINYVSRNFTGKSYEVIAQANKILREYEAQGYDITLRQLYYQFVSRGLIANSDREYKKLGSIVNDARLAGLIDWHSIVDRTRFLRTVPSWDNPAQIIRGAANGYRRDLWENQDNRIEVWIEKDALVGVIERACQDLRVPFLSCRGYTSQSEMWTASQRFFDEARDGKKVHVLHLGDHDPSGIDMTRDITDRIRLFMATDAYQGDLVDDPEDAWGWVDDHFELERLALNWDQIQQYDPPPNPAKLTDSRGRGYVDLHGNESWELDALEPTVIGDLIRDAVLDRRDEDLWSEALAEEDEERQALQKVTANWSKVSTFLDGLDA